MGLPSEDKTGTETRPGHHLAAILLALCGLALAYLIIELDSFQSFAREGPGLSKGFRSNLNGCANICSTKLSQRLERFGGRDLLSRIDLKEQLEDAKNNLIQRLKGDYGDYFHKIFVNPEDGSFIPIEPYGNQSFPLLERKLMIKVLSAQKRLKALEANVNGCHCEADYTGNQRRLDNDIIETEIDQTSNGDFYAKYVWSTGGHSAAAAHGNLYNESYTAIMEQDLKEIFGSIGIEFEGRNYAMGGTQSAAEMAMCWKEIFGDDTDFFSWDFGMMDSGNPWRLFHFVSQGIRSENKPPFLVLWMNSEWRYGDELHALTACGFPAFHISYHPQRLQQGNIPDSLGLPSKEIDALPPMLKYFKCKDGLEKNECDEGHKYTEQCPKRFGKASWHPGFKWHALWGHSIALYVMQSLISAVDNLLTFESESLESLLGRLEREEKEHYNNSFRKLDEYVKSEELREKVLGKEMDYKSMDQLPASDFDMVYTILRGESICHTSRIPSQIRYLGHLTQSDKVGGPSVWGEETYDIGIELKEAQKMNETTLTGMPVVWDASTAERKSDCPFVIAPDPKDYFYIQYTYGWQQLTIPNDATRSAYQYDPSKMKGVVMLILQTCDWGNCPKEFLTHEHYGDQEKGWELKVNSLPVTNITLIGNGAIVVHNGNDISFPPGPDGEYKLEFHVNHRWKYMRLTSAIIF